MRNLSTLGTLAVLAAVTCLGGKRADAANDTLTVEVKVTIQATTNITWSTDTSGDPQETPAVWVAGSAKAAPDTNTLNFGETRNTDLDARVYKVKNIGNKMVNLTIEVTTEDTTTAVKKWTMTADGSADIDKFGMWFMGGDIAAYAAFTGLLVPGQKAFKTGLKLLDPAVQIKLQYKAPTDTTADGEIGTEHKTTLTVTGTSE